ncbi:phospholipase A2 homolog ECS_00014-like [Clavelina lepadiformis]|uniref:Phospholipase A2 n=1 Tax=Clavelina lepadiformis TaxID=159417 RepID=A0ABP0GKX0_CLALP
MNTKVFLLLLSLYCSCTSARTSTNVQSVNVGKQILCFQGKSWSVKNLVEAASDFQGYGCWCGAFNGGGSRRVVDAVDSCCKAHDLCFDKAEDKLPWYIPDKVLLGTPYTIVCENNMARCEGFTLSNSICKCDRVFAECIARNINAYNSKYAHYKTRNC